MLRLAAGCKNTNNCSAFNRELELQ